MTTLQGMPAAVMAIVVLGIIIAIGAKVTESLFDQVNASCVTCGAGAANATLGIAEIGGWMPTVGLVLAASLIIGLIVGAFAFFGRER